MRLFKLGKPGRNLRNDNNNRKQMFWHQFTSLNNSAVKHDYRHLQCVYCIYLTDNKGQIYCTQTHFCCIIYCSFLLYIIIDFSHNIFNQAVQIYTFNYCKTIQTNTIFVLSHNCQEYNNIKQIQLSRTPYENEICSTLF